MDLITQLRAWTYRRQRLGAHAVATAEEALCAVIAVYSAHPTAPLALAARTVGMTGDDFRDLEQRRVALRIPGMRGSLFLAPRQKAASIFLPGRLTAAARRTRLARAGVTEAEYAEAARRVLSAAATPRLPRELADAAGVSGLALSTMLRTIRGEGRMLAVADAPLRAARLRYVATDSWAPDVLTSGDDDALLTSLAGDYLTAFGPARVADFAWWAGVNRGVAGRALEPHHTIDVGGGLLLPAGDEAAFASVAVPRGAVDLLPKWDAYTMGFAPDGRARLVHADNQARVYVQPAVVAPGQPNMGLPGDGYPIVLVDGEAAGTWHLTTTGATTELFDTAGVGTRRRLDQRLEAANRLLAS